MKKTVMMLAVTAMLGLAACSSDSKPEQTEKQQDSVDKVQEKKDSADVEALMRADEEKEARMKDSMNKAQQPVK